MYFWLHRFEHALKSVGEYHSQGSDRVLNDDVLNDHLLQFHSDTEGEK
jgi:hypothetical protein